MSKSLIQTITENKANIKRWELENWTRLSIAKQLGITDPKDRKVLYMYIDLYTPHLEHVIGSKTIPYYEGEEFDPPEYTWEELPENEKILLNLNDKTN